MRNKRFMIIALLILAVGFASVSTVLYITGNLAIATNDDFDVYFSGAILDNEDKTNELVIDKKHIVYKTKELKKVNDESVLVYEVTNGSTQYDADVVITCTPNSTSYYEVITTPSSLTVEAGHVETGIVTVKQKKYSTEVINEQFECELVANAVERNSTGDDVQTVGEYAIEGILKDKDGNILPNTDLVVYSNSPHEVKTDRKGYFYVDNLEKGIHEIYLKTDADINDKEATKNASSFGATLTTNNVYKVTKGNYMIDNHNTGLELEDKTIRCEYQIGKEWNYEYTGSYQEFDVDDGCSGTYKVELWGAHGSTGRGGNGAYTSGLIKLQNNDSIYVYVGKYNTNNGSNIYANRVYEFNGGGYGNYVCQEHYKTYGVNYSGGGATDVRIFASKPSSSDLSWNSTLGLRSRIMVAAGGGGGHAHGVGGAGGGINGYAGTSDSNPSYAGNAASQTSAGRNGSFGIGGGAPYGGAGCNINDGAGGGGGYYGGGAATTTTGYGTAAAAGSGSSFISGHVGCNAINSSGSHTGQSIHYSGYKFTNTVMIDGNGYTWSNVKGAYVGQKQPDGTITSGRADNGYARITLISLD